MLTFPWCQFHKIVWIAIGVVLTAVSASPAADDDELVQLVIGLLEDKDKDVRALGLEQVRTEAKGQAATRRFAAQLRKLPPEAQVGLLSALADRGDPAARLAVLDILAKSKDDAVSAAAIEALGPLGEAFDVPRLVQLLSSGSKTKRAAARMSLVRLSGEGIPAAIAGQMHEAPPEVHVALIEVLAARRALDTIPDLLSAAVDGDASVRTAAMSALGQLAGREHVSGMVQGVLKAQKGREREAAEKAVMFVCARIPDADRRAEPLLAAMDSLAEADRLTLLPTLGRIGGPAALKVVEAAVANPQSQPHSVGVRALCNWPDASIAPRLILLANSDEHAEHRAMARLALVRVAPLPDKRSNGERLELLATAMRMCDGDEERKLVLLRASAIRAVETLRFVAPYLDEPALAQPACEAVVELAHHRGLREPNKAEFDRALDKVLATSKDAVVLDRATRYKKGQTWTRPATGQ